MLNWLRGLNWAALAAAALFLAFAYGAPCFSSQGSQGHEGHLQAANAHTAAQNTQNNSIRATEAPAPDKAAAGNHEKNNNVCLPCLAWEGLKFAFWWWVHDPNGFFGGWVAIFTLVLAVTSGRQIVLSRREFEASHRPWVSVSCVPNSSILLTQEKDEIFAGFQIEITLENVGTSPALAILYGVEMVASVRDNIQERQNFIAKGFGFPRRMSGFALFPGQKMVATREVIARFPVPVIEPPGPGPFVRAPDVTAGFIMPFVSGCAVYTSQTKGVGETRFCYAIAKDQPSNFMIGGVGNAIAIGDEMIPQELVIMERFIVGNDAR
jgi:hypothetical protein